MMFFQEIFKNADPDKRRAMIKSFQTSSGTVLSTDWQDVSSKDYEGKDRPSPPKGQEWRKPEIWSFNHKFEKSESLLLLEFVYVI